MSAPLCHRVSFRNHTKGSVEYHHVTNTSTRVYPCVGVCGVSHLLSTRRTQQLRVHSNTSGQESLEHRFCPFLLGVSPLCLFRLANHAFPLYHNMPCLFVPTISYLHKVHPFNPLPLLLVQSTTQSFHTIVEGPSIRESSQRVRVCQIQLVMSASLLTALHLQVSRTLVRSIQFVIWFKEVSRGDDRKPLQQYCTTRARIAYVLSVPRAAGG